MKSDKEYLNSIQNKYGKAKALRRRRINTVVSVCMCLSLAVMISVVMINGGLFAQVTGSDAVAGQNKEQIDAETCISVSDSPMLSDGSFLEHEPAAVTNTTDGASDHAEDISVNPAEPLSGDEKDSVRSASEPAAYDETFSYTESAASDPGVYDRTDQSSPDGLTAAIVAAAAAVIIAGIVLLIANNLKRKD